MKITSMLVCGLLALPQFCLSQEQCGSLTNENEVIKTIMLRRSVRKYLDKTVEHEKLATIAMCGVNAPNGMNKQPWAVRVVESADFINGTTEIFRKAMPEQVARDKNFKNMYRNAPAIIVVASPADGSGKVDVGLMGENMILAAQSLGLGTCCLGGHVRFLQTNADCKPYLEKLNIPSGYDIAYIIAVGYPDETPEQKPRDESKIEYIR